MQTIPPKRPVRYLLLTAFFQFDRRDDAKNHPWDEKIYWQEEASPAGSVTVLGC